MHPLCYGPWHGSHARGRDGAKMSSQPHADDLEVALEHYNDRFRHRYLLRGLLRPPIDKLEGFG
jgi:hypothetical protein